MTSMSVLDLGVIRECTFITKYIFRLFNICSSLFTLLTVMRCQDRTIYCGMKQEGCFLERYKSDTFWKMERNKNNAFLECNKNDTF